MPAPAGGGGRLAPRDAVHPGVAVAVVRIRAAVKAVIAWAGSERVAAHVSRQAVLAARGSEGLGDGEVRIVPEDAVVAAAAVDHVVTGIAGAADGGVAPGEGAAPPPAGDPVVTRAERAAAGGRGSGDVVVPDRDEAAVGAQVEDVVAVADRVALECLAVADQELGAGAAIQHVIAAAGGVADKRDRVARHVVVTGAAEQAVVPVAGCKVARAVPHQAVIARAAVEDVVVAADRREAATARDPDVAKELVIAGAAVELVLPEPAVDLSVVSAEPADQVVATPAVDRVVQARADDHVIALGAVDDPRTGDRRPLAQAPGTRCREATRGDRGARRE